ncbi:MAG TPA: DnaJ domain-containing protein [Pyrinomonadaceae bacterium]|nr:DnaJ domain-containing protein [Pyrinomonadaceae bacterium]
MSQFDSHKDYYAILGVDKDARQPDIDRSYRRLASKHHPDRGGSEEHMKLLNEAYGVIKDADLRREYDMARPPSAFSGGGVSRKSAKAQRPVNTPTARDVGVFGHVLSAGLCLAAGLFLLLLVRFQWIWFLWPLAILAVFVVGFGVLLARSAMVKVNESLPVTNRLKRHTKLQELAFWVVIITSGYGLYLLMSY